MRFIHKSVDGCEGAIIRVTWFLARGDQEKPDPAEVCLTITRKHGSEQHIFLKDEQVADLIETLQKAREEVKRRSNGDQSDGEAVSRYFAVVGGKVYRLTVEYREAISNDGDVEWVGEEVVAEEVWDDEAESWVLCTGEVERQILVETVEEEGWYGYQESTYANGVLRYVNEAGRLVTQGGW